MVRVNLIGFDSYARKLAAAPEEIVKEIEQEVIFAAEAFAGYAKKDVRAQSFDNGKLAGGIQTKKISSLTYDVTSTAKHSPYVEFGTKRKFRAQPDVDSSIYNGKGGGTMAQFIEAIKGWVKRKGIRAGTYSIKTRRRTGSKSKKASEDNALVMGIVFAILRNGVKARPFFFKQRARVKKEFIDRLNALLK